MAATLSQRLPSRTKNLGSSWRTKGICANSLGSSRVWSASPLLAKRTLPAASVTLATATVGASPIILTDKPTQPGRFWSSASLDCSATEVASYKRRVRARISTSAVCWRTRMTTKRLIERVSSSSRPASICKRIVRGHQRMGSANQEELWDSVYRIGSFAGLQISALAFKLDSSAAAIWRPWKRPFSMKISLVREPATTTPAR